MLLILPFYPTLPYIFSNTSMPLISWYSWCIISMIKRNFGQPSIHCTCTNGQYHQQVWHTMCFYPSIHALPHEEDKKAGDGCMHEMSPSCTSTQRRQKGIRRHACMKCHHRTSASFVPCCYRITWSMGHWRRLVPSIFWKVDFFVIPRPVHGLNLITISFLPV